MHLIKDIIFSPKSKLLTHLLFSLSAIFMFTTCQGDGSHGKTDILIPSNTTMAVIMADSEMHRLGDSLSFGYPEAKWNYQTGLFLKALLDLYDYTHTPVYLNYVKKTIDSYVKPDGSISTYNLKDYNLDKINSGKVLLRLYQITGTEKYKLAADNLRNQLREQPRTKEGGFWHKERYPWQMWLDGIYMEAPFFAEYTGMFESGKNYEEVVHQIVVVDKHTRDPKTGLRYHGWDESNKQKWADPETGCSPNFWGRAMGWYAMALVDVLDFLPADYEKREQVIFIYKDLVKSIEKYQDPESGAWYQVLDQGDRDGNYLEGSASAMFVYAIAKGIRKNYLNDLHLRVVKKGYNGMVENFINVDEKGLVSMSGICSVAGLGGDPYRDGSYEYYISEPVVSNDLKGVGPFIMAALQIELLNAETQKNK
jgi:unsaturated rhamnogalacturonyl hydrolase